MTMSNIHHHQLRQFAVFPEPVTLPAPWRSWWIFHDVAVVRIARSFPWCLPVYTCQRRLLFVNCEQPEGRKRVLVLVTFVCLVVARSRDDIQFGFLWLLESSVKLICELLQLYIVVVVVVDTDGQTDGRTNWWMDGPTDWRTILDFFLFGVTRVTYGHRCGHSPTLSSNN